MIIAISAGHSHLTAGKRTCPFSDGRQMREHEFNRDVAFALDYLLRQAGHTTVLCFDEIGVTDMALADRVGKANKAKADVYISVHANAFGDGVNWHSANGLVAMYYTGSVEGERLAKCIMTELSKATNMPINSYQPGKLYEPKYTAMPCVIVECGFMTNKNDAQKLLTYEYRQLCAESISRGLTAYFSQVNKANDILVVDVPKSSLNTLKTNRSVYELSKEYKNFVNGMFFSWDDNTLYDMCVSNEKYLENKGGYDWSTKPKGTFYLYKDGRCGVGEMRTMSTIKDLQMLVQGINLADLSPEAMKRQGWNLISLTEKCRRAAIGYDKKDDKIRIIIKTCNLLELQAECINNGLVSDGKACAIALDAGGSFAYVRDGKAVYNTERFMRNIIYW